jgi:hypothetical protein
MSRVCSLGFLFLAALLVGCQRTGACTTITELSSGGIEDLCFDAVSTKSCLGSDLTTAHLYPNESCAQLGYATKCSKGSSLPPIQDGVERVSSPRCRSAE